MRRRSTAASALSPWPGYVDALSTLLMVLVFVLLVFVLAQAFLSVAISGRDQALDRLGRQVAELADMLSLERGKSADLAASVAALNRDLLAARAARDAAAADVAGLRDSLAAAQAARDAAVREDAGLKARLSDAAVEAASATARISALQSRLAAADARSDAASAEAMGKLADQVRALMALRDQLAGQVAASGAKLAAAEAARDAAVAKRADAEKLSATAAAKIDLLTHQVDALRSQLAQLASALEGAKKAAAEQDARIADLGTKLNAALLGQVQELQRYRSEFFGKLRAVLAGRPGISEVGDRFVFQSEVLFASGSADLSPKGAEQIRKLAATLKAIAADIPAGVNWVLRVDGHADRQQVHGKYASNWELSAARAISVVRLLMAQGIPADRLVAAGLGEFQPLDPRPVEAAYARNRRIELRLTDR